MSSEELVASLPSHSKYFDHLVELIPPRYYYNTDADRVNTKFMKKADRAAAKQAFRKQGKQVRFLCKTPAPPSTGMLQLRRHSISFPHLGFKGSLVAWLPASAQCLSHNRPLVHGLTC